MNGRENTLKIFRNEQPDFFPRSCDFHNMVFPGDRCGNGSEGKDWFGVNWVVVPGMGQMVKEEGGSLLSDISNWESEVTFPDFSTFDWEKDSKIQTLNWDKKNQMGNMTLLNGMFERLHALMGFENSLIAFYTDGDRLKAFFEAITEYKIKCLLYAKKYYNPDLIIYHDDWGTNLNLFFSPALWREYIKPYVKRIVDETHSLGMYFEMHSCGKVQKLVGELVDDLKIDSIQPLQYPQNDICTIKKNWGDRLIIRGGYNGQLICKAGADRGEIAGAVHESIGVLAPGGNHIPYYTPIGENPVELGKVLEIFEEEVCNFGKEFFSKGNLK